MGLNNLKPAEGSTKSRKRIGRGEGSGRGGTSTRGHKGQKSRKGVSIRWFEGGQTSLVKRLPKRGFNPLTRDSYVVINLQDITRLLDNSVIDASKIIDRDLLKQIGYIKESCSSKIKLLSFGVFNKKVKFRLDNYSRSAKSIVEKLGGECQVIS